MGGRKQRFCGLCGRKLGRRDAGPVHASCAQAPAVPIATAASAPTAPTTGPVSRGPVGLVPSGSGRDSWSGRPREFRSSRAWVGAACVRNIPAAAVAVAMAWFNAPIVVIVGTIGAVIGGIAGLFSGSAFAEGMVTRLSIWTDWVFPLPIGVEELLPTAAWQIGGIIGAAWGALNGALQLGWIAFYWPWSLAYQQDPAWPMMLLVGNGLTAVFCGVAFTVWSIIFEPGRLRMAGARRMSRAEAEWLMPIVEEVAARMNLASLPKVLVSDSREVNALTATRHIVLFKGLRDYLDHDREAIAGVVAHELWHWRRGDAVGNAFIKGVGLPLYIGYAMALRAEDWNWFLRALLAPLLWGVTVCVRYVVAPVEAYFARKAEMACDRAAARAGYGPGLYRALVQLGDSFDAALDGWDEVVLRSHPATELRLEALEAPGETYPQVADRAGTARPAPGHTVAASTLEEGW